MINPRRIHHVAIIASNYEQSKHFYTQVLGLEIIREIYRAERDSHKLDLRVSGGGQIELFSFPHPPSRPSRPEAAGLRHLAFEVDDVAHVKASLEAQQITVEEIRTDEITQRRFTFLADPDGLPIELYER